MKIFFTAAFLMMFVAACGAPTSTVNPALELERAKINAEYYASQLTATAVAPILEVTRAAAALEMTVQVQNLQGTQTAIPLTSTAQMWTPTVTPTPTPNATATMIAIRTNAEVRKIEQETERADLTNTFWAVIMPLVVIVLLLLVVFAVAYVAITYSRAKEIDVIERGEGDAPLLVSRSARRVIDMDTNPNFQGGFDESLLRAVFEHYIRQKFGMKPALPLITEERQDAVKNLDQMTDLKTRTKLTNAALDKFMKEHTLSAGAVPMPTALPAPVVSEDDINLPLPPWEFIKRWDGTSKPLGFGKTGLITAKSASPHILISGMTGSGKTIYMMRTLTATSLANGSQVVNIGYSNAGYGVFEHHANFHSVQLPNPSDVIECLAQVYEELKSRKTLIGGETIEWEYWPGGQPPRPFLDVHLDELGNMAEDIFIEHGPAFTKELWSYISRIANEGRKVGIRFVAALQDPTSKSMDLRFRRNCTLVAFRQGDRTQSDTFIGAPGAEQLSVGHFMARTDSLVIGGGFSPTDAELLQYLSAHKVIVAPKPKWIEGVVHSVVGNQIPAQDEPIKFIEPTVSESLPLAADEIKAMAESIRSQWTLEMSKTKVAKLLGFPQYGGSYIGKVDRVINYLTSTTTIERNSPETGVFEAIPA